jgi:hypothetical protein
VVGRNNNQTPTLDSHTNENMFAQYSEECLLKAKQTPIRIRDLLKKPTTKDKTTSLSFQKVGPNNEQLGLTWFKHFIVPFGTGKCESQHVLLHLEE